MPQAVILTALPVEYTAVRVHLTDLQEEIHPQGTIYERGIFTANGRAWNVGIVEIGAGNPGAALEAERAITHFNPDVILFVGVAGGIKDVALGDVVASTKVYGYESGKAEEKFRPRPEVGLSAYGLEQRARVEARKTDWLQRLPAAPSLIPSVFVAPIAAGEKVVASTKSEIFQFLRESYGDAISVEMEGFGFLDAARANQQVSALVIRGISDLIYDKTEADKQGYQKIAAGHASAFAFELLAKLDAKKKPKPDLSLVAISRMTAAGIGVGMATLLAVTNLMQPNPLDILKGSDLDKIAEKMPAIKQAIDQERQKVDTLPDNGDAKDAIADYNARKAQINTSLFLHQLFLQKVSDLKESGKLDNESKNYAQNVEKSLALMIHKYRIPFLAVELQQHNFGQLNENSEKTDPPDVQFTPGALRTTYEILMTESGAHADLDGDGTIKSPNQNNPREANQIPCNTLIEVQDLWKEATGKKCGWYGKDINNPHSDPECEKQLQKDNIHPRAKTLASIFSENYPDELVFRVKDCEKTIRRKNN